MSEASSMSEPPTYDLFGNAIFSPGLADGPTRSTSPGGSATDPSGQDHHPVSRFRARDSDEPMPTSDTSGPLFTNSSPSADLQRFLESRLRQSLAASGSPEFALTWSTWDLPSGVPICRLRASAHRTSGNGSSGWRSPAAQEAGITLDRLVTKNGEPWTPGQRAYDRETGRLCETGLVQQAAAAGWPTPNAVDGSIPDTTSENTLRRGDPNGTLRSTSGNLAKDAVLKVGWPTPRKCDDQGGPRVYDGKRGATLREAVAGWATPTAKDAADAGSRNTPGSKAHSGYSLTDQARGDFGTGRLAGWPTPCESDKKGASGPNCHAFQRGDINRLADLVAGWPTPNAMTGGQTSRSGDRKDELLISGLTRSGSNASTEKRGALSPRFSLWLQGYPTGWASCGEAVIRSSRKPPPSSSPR